jgi:hypothetical protein
MDCVVAASSIIYSVNQEFLVLIDVIQHPDVDQAQGVAEALGDELVGVAGFGDSGGVVVRQNHGGGLVFQGSDDDFAWVDAGAVDGAAEEVLGGDEAMELGEVD